MKSLSEHVAALTTLIKQGQTIEAMERFYADEVTMQENESTPRLGKAVCLEHEHRMLANVSEFKAQLLNQTVDERQEVVFSEWVYEFTDLSGQRYCLTEVSIQHWQNELIYREKFYYNKVNQIESLKSA
jgi:hypothetical protein